MLQNSSFFNFVSMEHFPQHPQKGVCNEIFTTKETCPPTLNFVYCFTGFIGRGADFTCLSVYVSKSC